MKRMKNIACVYFIEIVCVFDKVLLGKLKHFSLFYNFTNCLTYILAQPGEFMEFSKIVHFCLRLHVNLLYQVDENCTYYTDISTNEPFIFPSI